MKSPKYQKRSYRQWLDSGDLVQARVAVEETDLLILSSKALDLDILKQQIRGLRQDINDYIKKDNQFLLSLEPISDESVVSAIIRMMLDASQQANVGPMAAVAGAVAQLLGDNLFNDGYGEIIIENGGDIYLSKQNSSRRVGIFAGESKFSAKICLQIKPQQTPCGVCTSSGTIGHSLSLGVADSVVILAKDTALADAVATACCNLVKSRDDFEKAIEFAKRIPQVFGVVIILGDNLATWGKIEIVKSD